MASRPSTFLCRSLNSRPAVSRVPSRLFATTYALRNDAAPPPSVGTLTQKRPIGGFRGGIIGFFVGFAIASSYSAYHLLEEYKLASAALQTAVNELQQSTEKVAAHVRRIEAVEKDLKALSKSSVSTEDLSRVRAEMKKLYDGLHVEFLDLRSHVWGMQQDLHSLSQKEATTVRI